MVPPHRKRGIRYHGNYCGPGWSAGQHQASVAYGEGPPAIDEFDETCRVHDGKYNSGGDLKEADEVFYRQNIGRGLKRSAAALAVGFQGMFRKKNSSMYPTPQTSKRQRTRSYSGIGPVPYKGKRTVVLSQVAPPRRNKTVYKKAKKAYKKAVKKAKKRSKKARKDNSIASYQKLGTIIRSETGLGNAQDPHCIYIGVGTPLTQLRLAVCQTLVRMIFAKAGFPIRSFREVITTTSTEEYTIQLNFFRPTSESRQTFNVVSSNETAAQVATKLDTALYLGITGEWAGQFTEIALFRKDTLDTITNPEMIARVNLDLLKFTYKTISSITIQNQTKGDTSGNTSVTVNDVNPLVGKVYYTESGNHFAVNNRIRENAGIPETTNDQFTADIDTGGIASTHVGNEQIKPPFSSYFQRVKKTETIMLNPGSIAKRSVSRLQTKTLNEFIRDMGLAASLPATRQNHHIGCALMFALEKTLDSRLVGEAPVLVAAQLDHTIMVKYSMKKTPLVQSFQIVQTVPAPP